MRKWLLPVLLVIFCAYAAVQMMYSLNEREKPAEPPPASSATPTGTPSPAEGGGAQPSAGPGGTPVPAVDEAAATEIYKSNCLSCHGTDLQGQFGPALTTVGASMTAEQIAAQIENGGGGMPAFKGQLTDEQIQTITNWLAAKK